MKEANKYESKVMISKNGKTVEATRLIVVMSLGDRSGQIVQVEINGVR